MTEFSDDVLERELQHRLHEEMSGMMTPPNLAATVRRRHHRRSWGLRIAGAVPVVAAVALAATLVAKPADTINPALPPSADGGAPAFLNVSYVSSRTSAALANAADYVRVERSEAPSGHVLEQWTDLATDRHRNDVFYQGQLREATAITGEGPNNALTVNYEKHTYFRITMKPPTRVPAPPGQDNVYRGDFLDPGELAGLAADGSLQLVGPENLKGTETLHLRWLQREDQGYVFDLWVDAGSYLPVHFVATNTLRAGRVRATCGGCRAATRTWPGSR